MAEAPQIGNAVYETTTTTGTGNKTLAGAESGHQGFAARFGTGSTNTFYAKVGHQSEAEWEIGEYYMSDSTTLVRVAVLESSNADAAVNFSAGTMDVTSDVPAKYQMPLQEIQTISQSAGTSTVDFDSGRHRFFDLAVSRTSKTPTAITYVGGDGFDQDRGAGAHILDLSGLTLAEGDVIVYAFGAGNDRTVGWLKGQAKLFDGGQIVDRFSTTVRQIGASVGVIRIGPNDTTLQHLLYHTTTDDEAKAGVCAVYRGVDGVIFDATTTQANNGTGTANPPSITTVTDNAKVVAVGMLRDDNVTLGVQSGYTLRESVQNGKFIAVALSDKDVSSAGAEDPGTFTGGDDQWRAWSIALRPEDQWTQPTIAFSNVPSGFFEATLFLDYDGVSEVTWPSGITWEGERASTDGPPLIDGLNIIKLYTDDGGTSWYGRNESGGAHDDTYGVQTFTSTGTWIKPKGKRYRRVRYRYVGGGGAGGAAFGASAGGGGGASGTPWIDVDIDDLPDRVPVIVGAGGAGVASTASGGGDGGYSLFGWGIRAYGGGGGASRADGRGGGGGGGGLGLEVGDNPGGNTGSGGNGGGGGDFDYAFDGQARTGQTGNSDAYSQGGNGHPFPLGGGGAGGSAGGISIGADGLCGGGGGAGGSDRLGVGGASIYGGGGGIGAGGGNDSSVYNENYPGANISVLSGAGGVGVTGASGFEDRSGEEGYFPGGGGAGAYEDNKSTTIAGADGGDGFCEVVCY